METDPPTTPKLSLTRRWWQKFVCAVRGVGVAVVEEDSFAVHLPVAFVVLTLGALQGIGRTEWLLLVLCVAIVLTAELFNSALERLATRITHENDPAVRDALDMASGAVLVVAIGAGVIGAVVLLGG